MSYFEADNTIAKQIMGRPLNTKQSLAGVPILTIADRIQQYGAFKDPICKDYGLVAPEKHALEFYMLEHAAGIIRGKFAPTEPLGAEAAILDAYNREGMRIALRAFYYLILICCRESRHCGNKPDVAEIVSQCGVMAKGYAEGLLVNFPDANSIPNVISVLKTYGKAYTLGNLTQFLCLAFYKGSYGSSFGGKKWGVIADCLDDFVHGQTTPAMMLDTVWTLEHNTCAIFNKGMLYHGQNASALQTILNCQAAGQIPNLIIGGAKKNGSGVEQFVTPDLRAQALQIGETLGEPFHADSAVDWPSVGAKAHTEYKGKGVGHLLKNKKPKMVPQTDEDDTQATPHPAMGGQVLSPFPGFAVMTQPRHHQNAAK